MEEKSIGDSEGGHIREQQEELLKDLGSAVRSLLEQQSSNPQIWGVYSGMAKVLELIELVLKDGSTKVDYRGRTECRSFVLEASGASGVGMFGSCSIVGWAQVHLANQRLSVKLRELYSDKDRLNQFYREGSISLDPVYRQTFLLIIEALEHLDIQRLDALIGEDHHSIIDNQGDDVTNKHSDDVICKQNNHDVTAHEADKRSTSVESDIDKNQSLLNNEKEREEKETPEQRQKRKSKNDHKKTHRRSVSCPIIQETKVVAGDNEEKASNVDDFPDGAPLEVDFSINNKDPTNEILEGMMRAEPSEELLHKKILEPLLESTAKSKAEQTAEASKGAASGQKNVFRGHRRGASDSGLRFIRTPEPPLVSLHRTSEDLNSSQEIKGTWSQVLPAKLGNYQKPKANQSLVSFLSETGLTSNRKGRKGQLDRENAHFVLSEAMIGTLEHLGFDSSMRSIDEGEESDAEIRELKEKLRKKRAELHVTPANMRVELPHHSNSTPANMRTRTRRSNGGSGGGAFADERGDGDTTAAEMPPGLQQQKTPRTVRRARRQGRPVGLLSDGRTDTATTDQSGSTDCNSDHEGCFAGENFDKVLDSNDEEFSRFEPGSKDFLKDIPEGSAESIALSLLGQIGAGRLPPADQIPWLVTEQEAPQQLLPLPDSLPIDPDEDMKGATELRGNLVWAPPRPQLVLTIQEKPSNRKALLYQQRWQCAGCSLRVEQKYSKSFRFCHYLGKFFCTGCHENQMAIIPARVVQNWDFKKYPVSNFSLEILNSVYSERLFNILDLNPNMIRKVEKLKVSTRCRAQLGKMYKYISTCRFAKDSLQQMEMHNSPDPHLYSIQELYNTKFNKYGLTLRNIIGEGLKHVKSCQLCQARGYICEGCHTGETIFPFQIGVYECGICGSCYHKTCFNPDQDSCSKCTRLKERREKAKVSVTSEDEVPQP